MTTIYSFGDSVLDCGSYNEHGITPAVLLAQNDDERFPEFKGHDLATALGTAVSVIPRATDGATVGDLRRQLGGYRPPGDVLVLLTIGGNDLLHSLVFEGPELLRGFERELRRVLADLANTDLFVGTVYDPSFGDDAQNFMDIEPAMARRAHAAVNAILAAETQRVGGQLVDLHAQFLAGDPSWFTRTIEPSLTGASEVRRAFLTAWEVAHAR